jgi:hypothetical protein
MDSVESSGAASDSVRDIQSLRDRAQGLDDKADFWNTAVLVLMAVTGVAAVGLVVAQTLLSNRSRASGRIKDEIVAATEARLEEERQIRLELQQSLAPRRIAITSETHRLLSPFKGINAVFWVIPDFEAQHTASQIHGVVKASGWVVAEPYRVSTEGLFEGVTVVSHMAPLDAGAAGDAADKRSSAAAVALVDALKAAGWEANARQGSYKPMQAMGGLLNVPANTVFIAVGFKPSPFFDDEEFKKMKQHMDTVRAEMRRRFP